MSDLVGNPKDLFSLVMAQLCLLYLDNRSDELHHEKNCLQGLRLSDKKRAIKLSA